MNSWLRASRLVNSSLGGSNVIKRQGAPTRAQKNFIETIEKELGVEFKGKTLYHAQTFISYWKPRLEEKQNVCKSED